MDERSNNIPAGLRLKNILCSVLPIGYITLALAVFGCACVAADASDPASRYLTDLGSSKVLLAVLIAAIALPTLASAAFRGEKTSCMPLAIRLFSTPAAAASVFLSYFTYKNMKEIWGGISITKDGDAEKYLQYLLPACALISAIFFVLKIFDNLETAKFICSLGVFALSTLIIASLYLDFSIELNSPYKLAVQFAAVAVMLGTMADMRHILSKTGAGRFIYLKAIAAILALLASGLVFTVWPSEANAIPEGYFVYSLFYFSYAVSCCAELSAQTVAKVKSLI